MIESDTNCFRKTEEKVINSPRGFRERFMGEPVLPAISIHIQKLLRVKSRARWVRTSSYKPADNLSSSIVPLPSGQGYLDTLIFPSCANALPCFCHQHLKSYSSSPGLLLSKHLSFLCWAVSSQSLEPQGANHWGIDTHIHKCMYACMYACIYMY